MAVKKRAKGAGRPGTAVSRNTLGGKIRAARNAAKLSTTELGRRIGVSHATIIDTELGNTKQERRTLILLAQELKSDFGQPWLREYAKETNVTIPVVAKVAAGVPIDEEIQGVSVTVDPNFIKTGDDTCGLLVTGDSMIADHILDGDVLICHKNPEQPAKDSLVVVDFRSGQGAALKRWRQKGEQQFVLSSDHYLKDSPKYEHSMAEIGKLYEVVGLVRSLK